MNSSLDDLKQEATSSIVDRFIEVLSPFGAMNVGDFLPIAGLTNKANEFREAIKEARALAAELSHRADPEAGDRLWANLNPAVRLGMFSLLMPDATRDAAFASMIGPLSGLPDETACLLYLRALETDEEQPSLADLSEDDLVNRFIEFCLRNFMAWNFFDLHSDQSQIDASNNILTEIFRVLVMLKQHGALPRLVPLLKHENQNVRLWAADGALFVNEGEATAMLEKIADEGAPESARMYLSPGPGLTNVSAKRALARWRKERRGVYGLNPGDRPAN